MPSWGDEELRDFGRRLRWGVLHFRPEAMGTFGGGGPLDGPGTDVPIKYVRSTWSYHKITAARLHEDLAGLPRSWITSASSSRAAIGRESPNAADFPIGCTVRILLTLEICVGPSRGSRRWFPEYVGEVRAAWVPPRAG